MQTVSSRFGTPNAKPTFYDANHYTTGELPNDDIHENKAFLMLVSTTV